MKTLLAIGEKIDTVSRYLADIADYMVLFGVMISAGNAVIRKIFSMSSNFWLEIQWASFSVMVLAGAGYVLRVNEHVRVDIFYAIASNRGKLKIDVFGLIFFLIPGCLVLAWLCWGVGISSLRDLEMSNNSGGIPYWPVKILMPIGFFWLALQGCSELVKRIAALRGIIEINANYEKPLQ
jgi:TRAP-type mannitol/chloroaromatic compound transport system permease small subunit